MTELKDAFLRSRSTLLTDAVGLLAMVSLFILALNFTATA